MASLILWQFFLISHLLPIQWETCATGPTWGGDSVTELILLFSRSIWTWLFWTFPMNKNPPNVNFCVWLLSFSMTLSMFVQVVPYISCCGWGHCMNILITPFWVAFTLCLLWEAWQATVCGVVKSQTWLNYWGGMHTVMKKTAVNILTKFSM